MHLGGWRGREAVGGLEGQGGYGRLEGQGGYGRLEWLEGQSGYLEIQCAATFLVFNIVYFSILFGGTE